MIELDQGLPIHKDLTPDLESQRRTRMQLSRDGGDGLELGGDILAFAAIAPGAALDQPALFVDELHGQTVHFGFGHKGERIGSEILIEKPEQSILKGAKISRTEGVFQAEHGDAVFNLREFVEWGGTRTLTGRIRCDQLRVFLFKVQELLEQQVVFSI